MPHDVSEEIAQLYRESYRQVVGPLVRLTGSFERAEEAAQESFMLALEKWAETGVPAQPLAWLRRAARNRAIDVGRRGKRWAEKAEDLKVEVELAGSMAAAEPDPERIDDDVLRLLFTCCHPALPAADRLALTLHTVCGLTSDEVARALLVSRSTLQQRLVRAKRKIDRAGIPYIVPTVRDMPARLASVLHTLYVVFTEGYASTNDARWIRSELCEEAIRLVQLLKRVLPARSELDGLLALMMLHHARAPARLDSEGRLVRLRDQDRTQWDAKAIAAALPLVESALQARPLSRYAVEAAIAALHDQAECAEDTDWVQIVRLYDVMQELGWGGPVVQLNRAVAYAYAGHAAEALDLVDALERDGELLGFHLLHVARAELLEQLDRHDEAQMAWAAARELAESPVERAFLETRLRAVADLGDSVSGRKDRTIGEKFDNPVDSRRARS